MLRISGYLRTSFVLAFLVFVAGACGGASDGGPESTQSTQSTRSTSTSSTSTTTTTTVAFVPPSRLLFVGDSVAHTLQDALATEAAARGMFLWAATRPGCDILSGVPAIGPGVPVSWAPACDRETPAFLSTALSGARPDVVIAFSTWETADRIVDGVFYSFGSPEADAMLLQKFDELRARMTETGASLVLVTVPPPAPTGETVPQALEASTYEHLNDLIRLSARDHPGQVYVADLARIVCPTGPPCPTDIDGVVLRAPDGGHFDGWGPAWVAPRLLDEIVSRLAGTASR